MNIRNKQTKQALKSTLVCLLLIAAATAVSASHEADANGDTQTSAASVVTVGQEAPQNLVEDLENQRGHIKNPTANQAEQTIAYYTQWERKWAMGKWITAGFVGAGCLPLILSGYPYECLIAQGGLSLIGVICEGARRYCAQSADDQQSNPSLAEARINISDELKE